jgi:hypothetical protein
MNLDSQLVLGNTTDSTNPTSGAIRVSGGIGSNANIHAKGFHSTGNMYAQSILFAGNGAANTSLTNPVIVGKNIGNQYLQIALINGSNTGSSDYVAYGDNGTESEAWADLGFTSGGFNDANYTITDKNDGYLFVQGGQDNTGFIGGNLVIATGNVGKTGYRDIIFATNGFLTTNERFRYSHANNALVPGANATMDLGNTARYFGNAFANIVFSPTIISNGTYNTQIALGAASGVIAITSDGNSTQFGPSGTITLGGASQVVGGTFAGSGITLGGSQTDIFQNRGGNVTVQVGTSGTIANTWTFAQNGSFSSPGDITSNGNISGDWLFSTNASGDEGGEVQLAKPPNGTLSGGITIDAYIDKLRFFEQGGTVRGLSIDIAN